MAATEGFTTVTKHVLCLFPQMADKSKSGSLEIEQFVHFYKILTQRDEVWKVFQDYSGDGERLMLEELQNFLRTEQYEGEQSVEHAQKLIDCYEPSETGEEVHLYVLFSLGKALIVPN